jgi:predicted transcriptional regulator
MQITLNLDESLLEEALQLTKFTTQEELMNLALQELVQSRRKKNRSGGTDSIYRRLRP